MPERRLPTIQESLDLDQLDRSTVSGDFIRLSEGWVHYEVGGPSTGQRVVLIHGFSVPYFIWDPTFQALTRAGFHVLRYDLYGRGLSDRPDRPYNEELFDRQLTDLLDALGFHAPVDVVGLSLGGAITAEFSARHPERVRRLAFIGPAGMPMKRPLAAIVLQLPLIGEAVWNLVGTRVLLSSIRQDLHDPAQADEYARRYCEQMRYRGFKRALLSTIRSRLWSDVAEAYVQVGRLGRPTLLIWGRHDQVVPFALNEQLRAAIPQTEFHAIDGAGHIAHYERPATVDPLLIRFLSG